MNEFAKMKEQSRIERGESSLSWAEKKLIQRFRTAATLYKMQKRIEGKAGKA